MSKKDKKQPQLSLKEKRKLKQEKAAEKSVNPPASRVQIEPTRKVGFLIPIAKRE
ncbi:hypothetical protein NB532_20745 [Vibrio antiquarius]|uniref:hypothetical protein n=1 Tax=Vibrio antiquarius (strain Ex25) TaxID=150340 RepID=UPI0026583B6C|nr:hypothetical protein [Vibrio antiquarius]MCR9478827.1 hypothetical protein [Vibrio antiquarius]